MPVFLLPILAGGYYYYKNKQEQESATSLDSGDETTGSTAEPATPATPDSATTDTAEECPSIEVSLVSQQPPPPQPQEDDEEIRTVTSQVLTRKESTDTVQTETSVDEEIEQPQRRPIDNSTYGSSLLASSCVDCDQVAFLEMVECGNSSDCDSSSPFRTIIEC
ncbi:expressed unknown protein [Seminavis robusta]|uniref:Uncharacterized protein n=1 Tax=Seminavis robusta TaxID=568900 RepID=A0A9N8EYZ8_9STRA|nr:expressed unknown protein [Seminavis robusta]|eukprot:Sro2161_g317140.1 n/a (164) ;mRNA; f:14183-14674